MMAENKFLPNKLGVMGWVWGGRYGIERYAYALHRLTGLGILAYFLLHILVTTSRFFGMETWERVMSFLKSPVFKYGEFLVYLAFAYHTLNGVRLVLVELGFFLGVPRQPVYPYTHSVRRQRPLLVLVMVVAAVVVVLGGYDFLGLPGK